MTLTTFTFLAALATAGAEPAASSESASQASATVETPDSDSALDGLRFGIKAQAGGRYDDVRMCVATDAGTKGGNAADVSVFMSVALPGDRTLTFNLPLMRPILFAAAFGMLQFEPDVILTLRWATDWGFDLVYGPSLGVSLHYGPDYLSGPGEGERGPDFFAWGPRLGAYVGADLSGFTGLDLQIGLAPTVSPLFSADDPENHNGWIAGIMLDAQLGLIGGD